MAFLVKNANLFLLVLILVASVGLVGATVYFQNNFQKINTDYKMKLDELDKASKELETQRALLENTKAELSLKSQREAQLGTQYTQVSSEKENLSAQKEQLENQKAGLESDLQTASRLKAVAEDKLVDAQTNLQQCSDEKIDLQKSLKETEATVLSANSNYNSCLGSKSTIETRLGTCKSKCGDACSGV